MTVSVYSCHHFLPDLDLPSTTLKGPAVTEVDLFGNSQQEAWFVWNDHIEGIGVNIDVKSSLLVFQNVYYSFELPIVGTSNGFFF